VVERLVLVRQVNRSAGKFFCKTVPTKADVDAIGMDFNPATGH